VRWEDDGHYKIEAEAADSRERIIPPIYSPSSLLSLSFPLSACHTYTHIQIKDIFTTTSPLPLHP